MKRLFWHKSNSNSDRNVWSIFVPRMFLIGRSKHTVLEYGLPTTAIYLLKIRTSSLEPHTGGRAMAFYGGYGGFGMPMGMPMGMGMPVMGMPVISTPTVRFPLSLARPACAPRAHELAPGPASGQQRSSSGAPRGFLCVPPPLCACAEQVGLLLAHPILCLT